MSQDLKDGKLSKSDYDEKISRIVNQLEILETRTLKRQPPPKPENEKVLAWWEKRVSSWEARQQRTIAKIEALKKQALHGAPKFPQNEIMEQLEYIEKNQSEFTFRSFEEFRQDVKGKLKAGLDPYVVTRDEDSLLSFAVNKQAWEIVRLIVKYSESKDPMVDLVTSVASGDHAPMTLGKFVEWGLDPNTSLADGRTLFQFSIDTHDFSLARDLLKNGADPQKINDSSYATLMDSYVLQKKSEELRSLIRLDVPISTTALLYGLSVQNLDIELALGHNHPLTKTPIKIPATFKVTPSSNFMKHGAMRLQWLIGERRKHSELLTDNPYLKVVLDIPRRVILAHKFSLEEDTYITRHFPDIDPRLDPISLEGMLPSPPHAYLYLIESHQHSFPLSQDLLSKGQRNLIRRITASLRTSVDPSALSLEMTYKGHRSIVTQTGWPGHDISLIMKNRSFITGNKGGGSGPHKIEHQRIGDTTRINKELIKFLKNRGSNAEYKGHKKTPEFFRTVLPELLECEKLEELSLKTHSQKSGNCPWASAKIALRSLYLLEFMECSEEELREWAKTLDISDEETVTPLILAETLFKKWRLNDLRNSLVDYFERHYDKDSGQYDKIVDDNVLILCAEKFVEKCKSRSDDVDYMKALESLPEELRSLAI